MFNNYKKRIELLEYEIIRLGEDMCENMRPPQFHEGQIIYNPTGKAEKGDGQTLPRRATVIYVGPEQRDVGTVHCAKLRWRMKYRIMGDKDQHHVWDDEIKHYITENPAS